MHKITLTIIALLLLALPAQAQNVNKWNWLNLGTLLDGISLNASAATRTFSIGTNLGNSSRRLPDFGNLVLIVDYTHNNNGALTLTCTHAGVGGTADTTPTTALCSAGACTLSFAGTYATASLSADKKYSVRLNTGGHPVWSCVLSHGGSPDASDLATITGYVYGGP